MEGIESLLNAPLMSPGLPDAADSVRSAALAAKQGASAEAVNGRKTEELAKDFESVLLTRVLDEMKNTVERCSFEEDAAGEQVHGLFWLYLARDIADKGGFGLWKDLCRFFSDIEKPGTSNGAVQSLDQGM